MIKRVSPSASMDRNIMPHCVTNTDAEVRGDGRQKGLGRKHARLFQEPFLVSCEPRIAVHALELERHPVRTQITLFKNECPDPAKSRHAPCRDMIGAAISEHQNVGDLMLAQEMVEEAG